MDTIIRPTLHHFGLTTARLEEMVDWYATVLGTTPNAVSIRLHRARRKLADLLADERKGERLAGQEHAEERRPR